MTQATFFKTVAGWKAVFRNLESFPHPKLCVQCGKGPLPRLLEIHPDAKDQITSLGVKKLATCTKEGIHDYIVRTFIPRLTSVWQEDQKVATTKNTSSARLLEDQQRTLLLMAILKHPLIPYVKEKATRNSRQLSSKHIDLSPWA